MKWGPWTLNPKNLSLETEHYDISLKSIKNSATLLDWIFQVQAKTWADPQVLHGLLAAFEDVLHPQANYCSMGVDRQVDSEKLAREYVANPTARDDMVKAFLEGTGGTS